MKKLLLMIIAVGTMFASVSYYSLHQYPDANGYKTFKEQFINNGDTISIDSPILYYNPNYRVYKCDNESICKDWCVKDWMRYRLYIPTGTVDSIDILIATRNNSSFFAMLYFVPDNSTVQNVDFNNYKEAEVVDGWNVKDIGNSIIFKGYSPTLYRVLNVKKIILKDIEKYTNKSGWLYVALAQSDQVMDSWNGYQYTPRINITTTYHLKSGIDKIDYLRSRKFTSKGDPIENFSILKENPKLCTGTWVDVKGDNIGTYIFDPDKPVVTTSTLYNNNELELDIKIEAGNAPLEGISTNENQNVSINLTLDDCLSIKNAESSKGEIFYSNDNKVWVSSLDNESYKFVKVELSPSDSSGVVLYPNDSVQFKVETVISDSCTKSTLTSYLEFEYLLKDKLENISKNISFILPVNTISSSYSSISSSSSSSIDFIVTTNVDGDTKEKCEDRGGVWLDSLGCSEPSSSSQSSSSSYSSSSEIYSSYSSSSSSVMSQVEDMKEKCESEGGVWLDSLGCSEPSSSSHSSSSSYSSSSDESNSSDISAQEEISEENKTLTVLKTIKDSPLKINGYFTHYAEGAYDWIYVSTSKRVYKLEGMDENGYLEWLKLSDYISDVELEDGVILIKVKDSVLALLESPDSEAKEKCESEGGVWLDSLGCSMPSSSSEATSSSESSSSIESSSSSVSEESSSSSQVSSISPIPTI